MSRRTASRPLPPGFRIAVLPALLAAGYTVSQLGIGRKGRDLAIALVIGVMVLFAIGLPIDLWLSRRSRR